MTSDRPTLDHLFISPDDLSQDRIELGGEDHFHLCKVKRARTGEEVSWSDGAGRAGRAVIEGFSPASMHLRILESHMVLRRRPLLHLFQALPKGSKMDEIVRKNVEMGVDAISPFVSSRSLQKPGRKEYRDRLERWRRIARDASRQSRREFQPMLQEPLKWEKCLELLEGFPVALVAWEGEDVRRVADALPGVKPDKVAMFIGPEGGFDPGEIEGLERAGAVPVSLGRNILRTENAGMVLTVLVESFYGSL